MRNSGLAALLAFASAACAGIAIADATAGGDRWREIVRGANSVGYADIAGIERSGAIATMDVMIDYPTPPFDGNNLRYHSLTMRNEYHCEETRFRVLAISSYAAAKATGERRFSTDEPAAWEAVSPKTIQQPLWEAACARR